MVKLIAADMDGTLVNSSHTISDRNVEAVKKAQKMGIEFVITTGRSYEDTMPQVRAAGLQCNYLLMNGSELRNSEGEIIQVLYLEPETVAAVIRELEAEKLYIELYTNGNTYSPSSKELCKRAAATKINFFIPQISLDAAYEMAEQHEQYQKIRQICDLQELWDSGESVGKVISFSNDVQKLGKLREELPKQLPVNATGSFPINLEITNPGASKGAALKRYVRERGISLSEVMTVGDSFNDLSMLSDEFGYTVAMGNAAPEVKKAAKYMTGTNDEDGVGTIIETLIM